MAESRFQANVRVSKYQADAIFTAAGSYPPKTFLESVQALVAKGLCFEMEEHAKPVSRFWLSTLVKWGNCCRVFNEFRDAVATDAGVQGPMGNIFRFEPVPDGCSWAEEGRQVYLFLHKTQELTPGGHVRMNFDDHNKA